MPATWHLQSPPGRGAVAIFQLAAPTPEDLDRALARLGIAPIPQGAISLRNLAGIDHGLIARWSPTSIHLMPHGGPAITRALAAAMLRAGIPEAADPDPRTTYPEARSDLEARMLAALARAASPLAIDLLLDQPRRWADHDTHSSRAPALLSRLIDPPLVVAIGPPNIGKSTLLNALAGRRIAIVADAPGTTRDHVGALIDLAGLFVRYIDTPGIRPSTDPIETHAARLAAQAASRADLILTCTDSSAADESAELPSGPPGIDTLRIALRTDLSPALGPHDAAVSALTGQGLSTLVSLIRNRLVPPEALHDPRPWRFWA